jgi:hypothetical protein
LKTHTRQALGPAVALLAAALVAAACGHGAVVTTAPSAVPTVGATVTPEPSDATSVAPTFDPGSAIDAVDSDLASLGQILSGLDSSVTQSDGGAYGGE